MNCEIQTDIADDDWKYVEDTLKHSKYYLHDNRKNCYVKWDYSSNRQNSELEEMGLSNMKVRDIIYPIEDIYYGYFLIQKDIYSPVIADVVASHRNVYEEHRWKESKSKEDNQ